MKTLKEIQKEVEMCADKNKKEEIATCYMIKLKEQIGDNKCRLLTYLDECEKEVDLNMPTFWMSSCATIISTASLGMDVVPNQEGNVVSLILLIIGLGGVLLIVTMYQSLVTKGRKKYSIILSVLKEIEKDMNKLQ